MTKHLLKFLQISDGYIRISYAGEKIGFAKKNYFGEWRMNISDAYWVIHQLVSYELEDFLETL